jgi:hypothetical protein
MFSIYEKIIGYCLLFYMGYILFHMIVGTFK